MNKIFYNSFVDIFLFGEIFLAIVALYTIFKSLIVLKSWDFESFSSKQYKLENSSYFIIISTYFMAFFKFLLLLYFVYTIDDLSNILPGAMCGAGVLYENSYGVILLSLQIIILFLLTLFIALNHYDLKAIKYPYFKLKIAISLIASILIVAQLFFDFSYFNSMNLNEVVSCCSGLYGNLEGQNPLPFNLSLEMMLWLFNLSFLIAIIAMYLKNSLISFLFLTLFLYISYYSVVYFFGLYIYELPTHKCPFCMMQKEYYYIGYFLWVSLIFGVFFGLIDSIFSSLGIRGSNLKRLSVIMLVIFISICYFYVAHYYIKNGVLL